MTSAVMMMIIITILPVSGTGVTEQGTFYIHQ
jgi:hypothetical protein